MSPFVIFLVMPTIQEWLTIWQLIKRLPPKIPSIQTEIFYFSTFSSFLMFGIIWISLHDNHALSKGYFTYRLETCHQSEFFLLLHIWKFCRRNCNFEPCGSLYWPVQFWPRSNLGDLPGFVQKRGFNSLVTCAECQNVKVQDWSCEVNCLVTKGNSGKWIYQILTQAQFI